MLLPALLLIQAAQAVQGPPGPVHNGRLSQLDVRAPRLEAVITVDGRLDEPVWQQAALLTGFSQFTPVDGVAATDSTEVLIWYSAEAMHIGVRAHDSVAAVRHTLAQRDRIGTDDHIQIFLSTFNDGRRATWLAANPLGVQADGAVNESGRGGGCSFFACAVATREGPDLSQDFVWHSVGRITEYGYELEIKVPLESVRFQAANPQTWGINILRVVQRSGQEQSWAPATVGQSSFLGQSGRLVDLEGLSTGRALDLIPTLTSSVAGARPAVDGDWDYNGGAPQLGGTLRWGVTPNLTMNATANPDFSQVEADVAQFSFNPRQALRFPERREFFLDGAEQFQVPHNLIYTRRIVQPVIAAKLAGKSGGLQIGALVAVDDRAASAQGNNPLFGIVRLTRDIGGGSQVGMVLTEQHDGDDFNRVAGVDGRLVLGGIHSINFNAALAHDRLADNSTTAPLWGLSYRRNGRSFRARYAITGIHQDFVTRSGFISQPGIADAVVAHSYTLLRPERTVESLTGEVLLNGTWHYDSLVKGGEIMDQKLHFNVNSSLRGGWSAGLSLLVERFGFDPDLYRDYAIQQPGGEITPFVGTPRLNNLDWIISMSTPEFGLGSFNFFALWGKDENYPEWASGDLIWLEASMRLRPSEQVRLNLGYTHTQVNRPSDGSRVQLQMVPHARLEFQITRALQLRLVGQYAVNEQDSLRDDSRTGLPIMLADGSGGYRRASAFRDARLRSDLLLTFLPSPGTVIYLGYGTAHQEIDPKARRRLERTGDGFFLKLSYLFRMGG